MQGFKCVDAVVDSGLCSQQHRLAGAFRRFAKWNIGTVFQPGLNRQKQCIPVFGWHACGRLLEGAVRPGDIVKQLPDG